MATDATGTPTTIHSIPKYNPNVDAPSGLGFNAAMDFIDGILVGKPTGIVSGEAAVWNGTAWVRSSVTRLGASSLGSGTADATKFLRGDGAWAAAAAGFKGFSAYANASQTPAASTWTKVQYNAEVFDTDNWYDAATNHRFTPLTAGKYRLNAQVHGAAAINDGKDVALAVYKNGAIHALIDNKRLAALASQQPGVIGGEVIVEANGSSDYFEIFFQHTDTVARAINSGTGANTFEFNRFQAEFLGA
jgi:hypothetical protein